MGWLERMNEVIDYIENNLNGEIDMSKAAKIAGCPIATLQRTFSIVCDISISEYIRRRRLTLAAFELQYTDIKVVDIAVKAGYESPEAFTRAFNTIHGVSPTAARDAGVMLRAYPRFSFHVTLKGDAPINYRIELKEAFTVYGIERIISTENGENWVAVPRFWSEMVSNGELEKLLKSTNLPTPDNGLNLLNALDCHYSTDNATIPYMIFAMKTEKSFTDGYKIVNVPSSTWAIFKSDLHTFEGTSDAIRSLIKRVYTEWLPIASYNKVEYHEFELTYKCKNMYYSEIWIRVNPREVRL